MNGFFLLACVFAKNHDKRKTKYLNAFALEYQEQYAKFKIFCSIWTWGNSAHQEWVSD